ncbi:class I SAM-dependent methyltransferase [Pseudaquabacterium pictum]|uniref:Methyltransferase n=1 Tax=Pseudaquabacterium pictum TaxID=2315236 RepID=A0A480ANQ6_9BURK|nr:class I SAM-dependent methyltransferase [Rubrivivax pictus]GCL63091.1 methyltransferase [Rubrivivax pictus]
MPLSLNLQRRAFGGALLAASLPGCAVLAPAPAVDDNRLRAAVAGGHRSAANRARDGARHPFETLQFFGLAPTHQVIELSPGGGWFTEILAPYLRGQGVLYAAHESAADPSDYRRRSRQNFDAKLAREPALYDQVRVGLMPRTPRFADIAPPGGADAVLTFRNVHNWMEASHLDATLQAAFAVLKPGGMLGVEEHRAPPGVSADWVVKNGYVPEALMVERAEAAGFRLAARSEVNANPLDTKNHPHGVWSLPPTLRGGEADRARFVAIGESDRFTHRYVKP